MALVIGVKRVIRHINRGGMGKVDEVELLDGTRAARKTFEPSQLAYTSQLEHDKLRKRFEREVKYQAELGRNGAMPILAYDLRADPPWFLMPLADKTYEQQIAEDRAANKISAQPLMDILAGLEQMHELGYVHRDLKPQNVLLWQGTWRLSDFGLAASVVSTGTSRFTTLSSWGTESYMAPEQRNDFKNTQAPADIYSFGCILHDLIDGSQRIPFVVQRVSGPYDYIVKKCTETDPSKRFRTIAGLRAVLSDELRHDPSLARSAATEHWASELENIGAWDTKRAEEFVAHLEDAAPGNELHIIASLGEDHLEAFAEKAPEEWEALALAYCDWARASFTFEFCDVIASRLRAIFNDPRSNVTVQANVASAMASIGRKNNRFYCMRLLKQMTDGTIADNLGQRIAMEIRANDLYDDFEHCAREVWGWGRDEYHPRIKGALDEEAVRRGRPRS